MRDSTTHSAGMLILADRAPEAWREVWLRSPLPRSGTLIRAGISALLIVIALVAMPPGIPYWATLAAAVLVFVVSPLFLRSALARLEQRVLSADRGAAGELLASVPDSPLVKHFAPLAWLPLQRGRLHLRRGDGAEADKALTEISRLSDQGHSPAMLALRAQALVVAGEYSKARQFLNKLESDDSLRPLDQLALGVTLLHTRNKPDEAMQQLEAARASLGGHPQVLAGLALAYHRSGEAAKAAELLELAEQGLEEETVRDEVAEDLVRRTKKALRAFLKTESKRSRKRERRRQQAEVQETTPAPIEDDGDAEPVAKVEAEVEPAKDDTNASAAAADPRAAADAETQPEQPEEKQRGKRRKKDKDKKKPRGRKARKQQRRAARKKQKAEERARKRAAEAAKSESTESTESTESASLVQRATTTPPKAAASKKTDEPKSAAPEPAEREVRTAPNEPKKTPAPEPAKGEAPAADRSTTDDTPEKPPVLTSAEALSASLLDVPPEPAPIVRAAPKPKPKPASTSRSFTAPPKPPSKPPVLTKPKPKPKPETSKPATPKPPQAARLFGAPSLGQPAKPTPSTTNKAPSFPSLKLPTRRSGASSASSSGTRFAPPSLPVRTSTPKAPAAKITAPSLSKPKPVLSAPVAPKVPTVPSAAPSAAPKVAVPKVTAPKITAPKVTAPKIVAPTIAAPTITAPTIAAPTIAAPSISASPPRIQSPSVPSVPSVPSLSPPAAAPGDELDVFAADGWDDAFDDLDLDAPPPADR